MMIGLNLVYQISDCFLRYLSLILFKLMVWNLHHLRMMTPFLSIFHLFFYGLPFILFRFHLYQFHLRIQMLLLLYHLFHWLPFLFHHRHCNLQRPRRLRLDLVYLIFGVSSLHLRPSGPHQPKFKTFIVYKFFSRLLDSREIQLVQDFGI